MNIDDVKDGEVPTDVVAAIFAKQHDLAVRYGPIERRNGFYVPDIDHPPHIDDPQFQNWIKGMLWRYIEEIAEAMEFTPDCVLMGVDWKDEWERESVVRHFFEELADAMHFLTEVSLLAGIDPARITTIFLENVTLPHQRLEYLVGRITVSTGLVGNTLKNKPWKSTHMPTDFAKFQSNLYEAWLQFARLWGQLRCSLADIYNLYHKKNAVNTFRQDTNY